ncbi:hypothetical protein Tco_0483066, partial [Tanacetum coccineum]
MLVCKRGKLFNEGLENFRCKEVREIEQEFLENGALEYHENKDHKSMMKFVRAFCSLWGNGNRGWPLKQFDQKEELCNRVKLLAKLDSDILYDFVRNELNILSDQQSSLT